VPVPVGTTGTTGTTDWDADIEERATIIEYDAGIPRAWAEGFAMLNLTRVPSDFSQKEWERVLDDGGRFLDEWADKASELGWTVDEVFGVTPYDSPGRRHRQGLVFLIAGGEVVDMSDRRATIRRQDRTILTRFAGTTSNVEGIWTVLDSGSSADRLPFVAGGTGGKFEMSGSDRNELEPGLSADDSIDRAWRAEVCCAHQGGSIAEEPEHSASGLGRVD
jgi:hypothetical protein